MPKRPVLQYITHAVLASYGIVLIAIAIQALAMRAIGPQNHFLDYVFWGPTFLIPIVIGVLLGACFGGRLPRLSSRLIFVFPLIIAAYDVWSWVHHAHPIEPMLWSLQDNFLGMYCGSSLCLEELGASAPLFSAIAYAAGSEFAAVRLRHRAQFSSRPSSQ